MTTRLLLPSGELSAYALRCGYVVHRPCPLGYAELYQEHGTYHVRAVNERLKGEGRPLSDWRAWESFPAGHLGEARRALRRLMRTLDA
jgi:hypothetical protein